MTNQQYTEQEFNCSMGTLDGWMHTDLESVRLELPDYYNDLNQLMPMAWKYGISLNFDDNNHEWNAYYRIEDINIYNTDPIQAIRDCLMQIWREKHNANT